MKNKNKRDFNKADLLVQSKKPAAIDINFWEGDNVIISKALINGIHRLEINGKRSLGLALSQLEQKKLSYLDDKGSWCVELNASDFSKTFELNPSDVYVSMQRGVQELLKTAVTLHSVDKETNRARKTEMPWMQKIEYVEGQGKISLKFNYLLTQHITRFINGAGGGYALYKITQAGRLRSVYSWRLFEMFSQFRDTGWLSIDIDDLHERLETSESVRKNFGKFKINLNTIIQELRDKCKLDVKYEVIKEGRRYSKIKFAFRDDLAFVKLMKDIQALKDEAQTPTIGQYVENRSTWHIDNLN
jgi:plasmid replication initiation protein